MRIALPKGRLFEPSMRLLKEIGISADAPENRSLIIRSNGYEIMLAKPSDVPVYVTNAADIGIVGSDITEESQPDVFIPLRLNFGNCRISLAVPKGSDIQPEDMDGFRIATKYRNITKKYFDSLGLDVRIIPLSGSIELAPSLGIADAIVDIVDTGTTLRENGLSEIHKIIDVYAQLIVNRISQKSKYEEINNVVTRMENVIENGY